MAKLGWSKLAVYRFACGKLEPAGVLCERRGQGYAVGPALIRAQAALRVTVMAAASVSVVTGHISLDRLVDIAKHSLAQRAAMVGELGASDPAGSDASSLMISAGNVEMAPG